MVPYKPWIQVSNLTSRSHRTVTIDRRILEPWDLVPYFLDGEASSCHVERLTMVRFLIFLPYNSMAAAA